MLFEFLRSRRHIDVADATTAVNLSKLAAGSVVADVTFAPPDTRFLRAAEEHGATTVDGLAMLVAQAAIAFKLWTDIEPNTIIMREAVEEFLSM